MLNIGIVISSTRKNRFGDRAAQWIQELAGRRDGFALDWVDLRDYPMPFFDEPAPPAFQPPKNEVARRWAEKVACLDGFIFVVAEYNHGPPAVLKNALDYTHREFSRRPAGYVGYGGLGAARAIEQLRLLNAVKQMAPISAVHISGGDFMGLWQGGKSFDDMPHLGKSADLMLDELAWWATTLKAGRLGLANPASPT